MEFLFLKITRTISPTLLIRTLLLLLCLQPWIYPSKGESSPSPARYNPPRILHNPPSPPLVAMDSEQDCAPRRVSSLPPRRELVDPALLRPMCSEPDLSFDSSPGFMARCRKGASRWARRWRLIRGETPEQLHEEEAKILEGGFGLGLLAGTIWKFLQMAVVVEMPFVGSYFNVLAALEDLYSNPKQFFMALLLATMASILWRKLFALLFTRLLPLRGLIIKLRGRNHLVGGDDLCSQFKRSLWRLATNVINLMASGSLIWILVFWMSMATMKNTLRLSIQISVLLQLLAPLLEIVILVVKVLLDMVEKMLMNLCRDEHELPAMELQRQRGQSLQL